MTKDLRDKFENMNMTIPQSARTKFTDSTLKCVPLQQFNMKQVNEKKKSANTY